MTAAAPPPPVLQPQPPPPPGTLNLVLLTVHIASVITAAWLAAHAGSWWLVGVAALWFALSNHALFVLMHEAVHGVFHRRRWIGELAGTVAAPWFPHAFSLQRAFHLSHHRNNRTDAEFFDGIAPHDHRLMKYWQWYGILVGEYWLRVPVACLLWLLCPWVLRRAMLRDPGLQRIRSFGGHDMLWSLERVPVLRSRLECLLLVAVQVGMFVALDLTWWSWLLCHAAFAIHWGALQYATHAWSERSVRDGAWDLRTWAPLRLLLLNYPLHLAHHRHPTAPWNALPGLVDQTRPRPGWLRQWLSMWRGPRPAWGVSPAPEASGGEWLAPSIRADPAPSGG